MKKNTFTRKQRLSAQIDFDQVFASAKKTSSKNLLALWILSHNQCGRVGIIVGKKVSLHAVTRNQIKRVIRDSYRLALVGKEKLDIIIIARPSCRYLSKINLRKEIDGLWQKLLTHYHSG